MHRTKQISRTAFGDYVRSALTTYDDSLTLACLITADRYYHIDTEIRPALTAGKTVICDRYITSLALDQLRGAPPDLLWSLHTPLPQPDLCIVLTGDTATITQRLTARGYHSRWQPGATSQELTLYTDVATQLLDRGWPVRFIDCTSTTPEDTATSITETLQAT